MGKLRGKDIFEVILTLPKFDWSFNDNGKIVRTELKQLIFVDYEKRKPRDGEDLYQHIGTDRLSLEMLRQHNLVGGSDGRCIGLISKVALGAPFTYENGFVGDRFAHIPMLDFDHDKRIAPEQLLEIIKRGIRKQLELTGLILRSSSRNNYHFIGAGDLLADMDFITFCGLSLGMKHKTMEGESVNLVDSRHVGHSLIPMKYLAELNGWSRYDFIDRFATLRITPKKAGEQHPVVIDVVE